MPKVLSVEQLETSLADLKAQIKKAKQAEKARHAETDKLRAQFIGMAVLSAMKNDQSLADTLKPIIDKNTKAARARKMLDLPPIPKNK